jgi:molecular chaperone DnaK
MLSKSDVDRMVGEAATHAVEDRQRREEVETRNSADALCLQADRVVRDLGSNIDSADKANLEREVEALRALIKSGSVADLAAKSKTVSDLLSIIGTKAYQGGGVSDAGPTYQAPPATDGYEKTPPPNDEPATDDTVEGEFKEV